MNNEITTDNMSNEEVIEVLKGIVFGGFDRTTRKERQALDLAIKALEKRQQGEPVIKCKDCKYQVKEWREDKRMKENGYWVYGCEHFGEIMGYWGFGGNDNEFCSDAEQKGGAE